MWFLWHIHSWYCCRTEHATGFWVGAKFFDVATGFVCSLAGTSDFWIHLHLSQSLIISGCWWHLLGFISHLVVLPHFWGGNWAGLWYNLLILFHLYFAALIIFPAGRVLATWLIFSTANLFPYFTLLCFCLFLGGGFETDLSFPWNSKYHREVLTNHPFWILSPS